MPTSDAPTEYAAWQHAFEEAALLSPQTTGLATSLPIDPLQLPRAPLQSESALTEDETASGIGPYKREIAKVVRLALPMSATNLCANVVSLVSLSFVGRLGEYEMSVAILATSIYNVSGLSLVFGFASAMETFAGQAFGAGNYHMVGVVYQRTTVLIMLLVIAVALLWSKSEMILHALGQDPGISGGAARYLHLVVPALFASGCFEASKRYLMAQGVVRPATIVTAIALALCPFYNWLLIFKMGWGLDGAALAQVAVLWTLAAGLGVVVMVLGYRSRGLPTNTWGGLSLQAFQGWGVYMRMALPSMAMMCCEWWIYEAVIIMSGWLPNPSLSVTAMGVAVNIEGFVQMLLSGFCMAASVRVSNSLGAGCPRNARRATYTAVGLTLLTDAVVITILLIWRRGTPRLFTNIEIVVDLVAKLMPILVLTIPGDGVGRTLTGTLRGSGEQAAGALANLCSYWFFGIPLAYILTFILKHGMYGLCWSLVLSSTVQAIWLFIIAMRLDYVKHAEKAAREYRQQNPLVAPLLEDGDQEHSAVS